MNLKGDRFRRVILSKADEYMFYFFQKILDWADVWAILIPIFFSLKYDNQPRFFKPIKIYIWSALLINLFSTIIFEFARKCHFPDFLQTNAYLYNAHSILRLICFSVFFIMLRQPFLVNLKTFLLALFIIFSVINFVVNERFYDPLKGLSGNLLTVEAYLLLIYCMQNFLYHLRRIDDIPVKGSELSIVIGLSVYVVINFFIFLFYDEMIYSNSSVADKMWNIHNVAYIILCFFLTRAFYVSDKN